MRVATLSRTTSARGLDRSRSACSCVLRLLRLIQRDADDDADGGDERNRLFQITKEQVDQAGCDEQQQHWLAHHFDSDIKQRARAC
jgi:hypothetical protein